MKLSPIVLFAAIAFLFGAMAMPARAFTHPCIPNTLDDLATIKASLNQNPGSPATPSSRTTALPNLPGLWKARLRPSPATLT